MLEISPEPWKQDEYKNIKDSNGDRVCFYGASLSSGRIAENNSKLATSAPDLYEALTDALKTSDFQKDAWRPWHDKARLALAKAEGRLDNQA